MKKELKSQVISVRLKAKEYRHLSGIALKNNLSLSKAVRYAITSTYSSIMTIEEKEQEDNYIFEEVLKKIKYLESRNKELEKILNRQIKEMTNQLKEYEKNDNHKTEALKNQMTISNVSN